MRGSGWENVPLSTLMYNACTSVFHIQGEEKQFHPDKNW